MYYWFFKYALFAPLVRVLWRPKVTGRENIPAHGPVILAANHLSAWDTILLPAMIRRKVRFAAKAELFAPGGSPRHRVVAWFIKAIGQVPMDRGGGRASVDGLAPILQTLAEGHVVGFFPEGTRSPDGRLYKGKTGVARVALHSGAPVVPVGMVGTLVRRGRSGLPTMRPQIHIGAPLRYPDLAAAPDARDTTRWVTDDVMAAIQDLTGQEYVNAYGVTVKKGEIDAAEVAARILPDPHAAGPARPVLEP